MPANEASGIGGRSYGRIALYLQEVSLDRFVLHYNSIGLETSRFFLVKFKIVALIREVKRSTRCFLRNRISSKKRHEKDEMKAQKKTTIENRLRPETHMCVCVCVGAGCSFPVVFLQEGGGAIFCCAAPARAGGCSLLTPAALAEASFSEHSN